MTTKSEFVQWRDMPLTQELFSNLQDLANQAATEILGGDTYNGDRVLFLKGYIQCISQVVGFKPETLQDED